MGKKCRRCAECADEDHHWLYLGHLLRDAEEEPVCCVAVCKHCDAIRRIDESEEGF